MDLTTYPADIDGVHIRSGRKRLFSKVDRVYRCGGSRSRKHVAAMSRASGVPDSFWISI